MEDALISPESFSILSGAGLIAATESAPIYVHMTSQIQVEEDNTIVIPNEIACWNKYDREGKYKDYRHNSADIFVMAMIDGEICSEPCVPVAVVPNLAKNETVLTCYSHAGRIEAGDIVFVDYYVKRTGGAQQIEITPDQFGGNYYLEAQTLFRREKDGKDMPAEFIIPNCKVQSNFNFSMASTGDPSTFQFTLDAFPDYVKFDQTHKVLAAIQVIEDEFLTDDETREPCISNTQVTAIHPDISLTFDNDSTEETMLMTAEGNNIQGYNNDNLTAYDKTLFNPDNELNRTGAAQIEVVFPVDSKGTYKVVEQNPVYKLYDGKDSDVRQSETGAWTKEKTYDVQTGELTTNIILSEERGAVIMRLYKVTDEGDVLVQTINFTNRISFNKFSHVTITNSNSKTIDSIEVDGETVAQSDLDIVDARAKIVITSSDADSITATGIAGRVEHRVGTDIYTMTVNTGGKDVEIIVS